MMTKKRDTVLYELKEGRKVVYIGTTNDPKSREQEHRNEDKKFSRMNIVSVRMTDEGAKRQERERLRVYRKNQGRNPHYNKDSDG